MHAYPCLLITGKIFYPQDITAINAMAMVLAKELGVAFPYFGDKQGWMFSYRISVTENRLQKTQRSVKKKSATPPIYLRYHLDF